MCWQSYSDYENDYNYSCIIFNLYNFVLLSNYIFKDEIICTRWQNRIDGVLFINYCNYFCDSNIILSSIKNIKYKIINFVNLGKTLVQHLWIWQHLVTCMVKDKGENLISLFPILKTKRIQLIFPFF